MISCLIPTYNGQKLLQKHLPDVTNGLPSGSQLIVSDDASTDNSIRWLCDKYNLKQVDTLDFHHDNNIHPDPQKLNLDLYAGKIVHKNKKIDIIVIHNHDNLRFSGAVNLGAQVATQPYLFIINNDVSPTKTSADHLLTTIKKNQSIFAVGAIEYENAQQLNPSGKNKLWFDKGIFQHSKADDFVAGETAWASGGSSLVNRDLFFELKGFDQGYYPAYWEDIDLSYRAKKRGYQILFEPKSVVYHQHESTHQTVWQQRDLVKISWRNGDRFTWKNGDVWQKISFLLWRPYWWWRRSRDSASQV